MEEEPDNAGTFSSYAHGLGTVWAMGCGIISVNGDTMTIQAD
jgi:hypothetical protein